MQVNENQSSYLSCISESLIGILLKASVGVKAILPESMRISYDASFFQSE